MASRGWRRYGGRGGSTALRTWAEPMTSPSSLLAPFATWGCPTKAGSLATYTTTLTIRRMFSRPPATSAAAASALSAAADVAGGLENIRRIVKVVVYVASDPAFVAQPQVANGASKMLAEVIGSAHARSAVGVAVLPLNAPVEVEIVVEV